MGMAKWFFWEGAGGRMNGRMGEGEEEGKMGWSIAGLGHVAGVRDSNEVCWAEVFLGKVRVAFKQW